MVIVVSAKDRMASISIARNLRLVAANGRGLSTVSNNNNGDSSEAPLVKIPELGEVKGSSGVTAWTQRKFYQFLGIRYAEPPTGKLRFKVRLESDGMEVVSYSSNELLRLLFQRSPGREFWTPRNSDVPR